MTQGIYCIENTCNGKRYIGKSVDIEKRISQHKYSLKKNKHHNQYLQNSYDKYGKGAFKYYVLEVVEDRKHLPIKEMFWIDRFGTIDKSVGYNLMYDSPDGYILHETTIEKMSLARKGTGNPNYGNKWTDEQKKLMSEISIKRHGSGIYGDVWKSKISEASKKMWQDDERRSNMARSVSEAKSKSYFFQIDKKSKKVVKRWDNIKEILLANPTWKWQNIYAACNGSKKSYMGYNWERVSKAWSFLKPSQGQFNEHSDVVAPWEL